MALSKEGFKQYLSEQKDPTTGVKGIAPTIESARAYKQLQDKQQVPNLMTIQNTDALKNTISTGNFTAKEAAAYNKATGNQQGAREVALGSPEALTSGNLKTSVSQEEVKNIQDMGVKPTEISPNITVDKGVRQEMLPQTEKTTVETPEGKTITTKETPTETKPITGETDWETTDKSLGTLEQMVEARYPGSIATQNPDGTLSAVIGDKKYQWNIGPDGKPVKTEVQLTPAEQIKMKAINKYMTASADELYSALINGNITREMEQSLMSNPNYAIAKEKVSKKLSTDNINSQMESVYNSMTGKPTKEDTTIEDMSNKTVTNLENKGIDIPKFSEYIAKDETLSADVISLNSQIKTIRELKDTAEANTKRIIEESPGISKASAILLSARQNEPLYEQIKALSYDATELQANINYRQGILLEDFKAELSQYQTEDQRDYNKQLLEEARAYNEEKAITDLENKYKYTYGDLDSDNPTLQNIAIKNALTDMYTKYQDIPGMESMAIKEGKVQDLIAQGMTGSQAIAQVESEIRNSQRYKDLITPQTKYGYQNVGGNLYRTDDKGNISLAIEGPNKFTKLDDGTYQDEKGNIITADEIKQQKLLGNNYLNAEVGTNVGVECGQYARSATGLTATPGGNSLSARIEAFADTEPTLGGLVLFTGGNYDKTYGHIAVITGVNPEAGTITIKESNKNGDKKVTERTINAKASTISGFYNNTPLAGGGQDENLTDKQYTQYNQAYSKFVGNPLVKNFEESLTAGGDLIASLKADNGPGDVGAVFQFMKTLDPTSVVRESEFAVAQNTAGLKGKYENLYDKVLNGEKLTDDQRKAFGKVAFEYVKNKGKAYDIKYDDFIKVLKNQGIPESFYPTRMTDYIKEFEGITTPATPKKTNININQSSSDDEIKNYLSN